MNYINTATGIYPFSEWDIKELFPNVMFGAVFVPPPNYELVLESLIPQFNQLTQYVVEGQPSHNGVNWVQVWVTHDHTPEQAQANIQAFMRQTAENLNNVLENYLNQQANQRHYKSMTSLCSYANSNKAKYKAEGEAGVAYRDACWEIVDALHTQVLAGQAAIPTEQELIAMLPVFEWPDVL